MKKINRLPYDCIGLVLAFFRDNEIPFYGTGFLLGEKKVGTAAHNVYKKIYLNNPIAEKVYFLPTVNGLVQNTEKILA